MAFQSLWLPALRIVVHVVEGLPDLLNPRQQLGRLDHEPLGAAVLRVAFDHASILEIPMAGVLEVLVERGAEISHDVVLLVVRLALLVDALLRLFVGAAHLVE